MEWSLLFRAKIVLGCQNVIARFCSAPCPITQVWPASCSATSRNITNVHYIRVTQITLCAIEWCWGWTTCNHNIHAQVSSIQALCKRHVKKVGFCNLNMLNGNWNQCTSIDGLQREAKASELIEMNLPLHEIFTTPLKFRSHFLIRMPSYIWLAFGRPSMDDS